MAESLILTILSSVFPLSLLPPFIPFSLGSTHLLFPLPVGWYWPLYQQMTSVTDPLAACLSSAAKYGATEKEMKGWRMGKRGYRKNKDGEGNQTKTKGWESELKEGKTEYQKHDKNENRTLRLMARSISLADLSCKVPGRPKFTPNRNRQTTDSHLKNSFLLFFCVCFCVCV